jgi:hypothetical protein
MDPATKSPPKRASAGGPARTAFRPAGLKGQSGRCRMVAGGPGGGLAAVLRRLVWRACWRFHLKGNETFARAGYGDEATRYNPMASKNDKVAPVLRKVACQVQKHWGVQRKRVGKCGQGSLRSVARPARPRLHPAAERKYLELAQQSDAKKIPFSCSSRDPVPMRLGFLNLAHESSNRHMSPHASTNHATALS